MTETVSTNDSPNYKSKAFKAAFMVVFGYGASQLIRLLGNLVLTRLLVPEYFGIMTIAQVFYSGIQLFSDFGIAPGVIRSKRHDDPDFLNTAWTIQVFRGFAIWAIAFLISYPVSRFYSEPLLMWIIPVLSIDAIFHGFQSTSLITLEKELNQKKITFIELIIQISGLVTIIILAFAYRTVWSLVIGSLVSAVLKTILSHTINIESPNSFKFDKAAAHELLSFGKWIIMSTAMMFLATQADRILLGKLFPLSFFGIYGIAVMFAELPKQIINHISGKVIFPLISKYSHLERDDLRLKIARPRRLLLIALAVLVSMLVCFGDILMLTLYDERYREAAWILPLLSIGIWPLILYATIDRSLYAIGKPNYSALGNFIKFIYMIIFVPLLYKLFGVFGAVMAVALNDLPVLLIINIGLVKEKLSLMKQDLFVTLLLLLIISLIIGLRIALGLGIPGESVFTYYP